MPTMISTRKTFWAGLGVAAALCGALIWQLQDLPRAPTVSYVLLDGKPVNNASWIGKVSLVNFWATSCASCVKKMPMLMATHRKYNAQGFEVLAVAMQYDPPDYVARFAQTRALPFGVAIDNKGEIARAFGDVRVTPTSVLIDKQGRIVKRLVGEIDEADLHAQVEKLLKG
jgi:thiol-disulfide isomerase/thioredoxin